MCNMKDSHVEWLGKIPVNWEIGRIKDYYKFQTGFTPDTTRVDYYDDENGHIWVSIADINERERYIYDSKAKISDLYVKEKRPLITKEGSLLYSFKLSVGKKIFAGKDLYTNEAIGSFIDENRVNLNYLYYSSFLIEENANINIYGAKLLNSTLISNSYTIFPPLEEQRLIAEFLDSEVGKINEAITKIEKQKEILEEYKKSLITEAIANVSNREQSENSNQSSNEYSQVKRLKDIANINENTLPESTNNDFEFNYIDISSVDYVNGIRETKEYKFGESPSRARRVVNSKDTLISTVRTYLKAIAYVEKDDNYIASTGFAVLTPKCNVNSKFLFYLMSSESSLQQIERFSYGVAYPSISFDLLSKIKVILPSINKQSEIVYFLDEKIKLIDAISKNKNGQLENLRNHKNSLIFEYVTGKKRVGG